MEQDKIQYLHLYPAQDSARAGEPLNVMFAVKNRTASRLDAELRLWLSPADGAEAWRLAAAMRRSLEPKVVSHVYMQVPAAAFLSAGQGDGQTKEFLLICANRPPAAAPDRRCAALIFVRP